MPNRSTQEIRGGTIKPLQPYSDELVYDEYKLDESWEYPSLRLRPGGWLCAIMIEKYRGNSDMKFELTDEDEIALYTEFTVYAQLSRGGIMLPEPIPNVNAAWNYHLILPSNMCDIRVVSINRQIAR